MMYHANAIQNKSILISDKVSFKSKSIVNHKRGYFMMKKRSTHMKDIKITLIDICF